MRFGAGTLLFDAWQARTADLCAIRDAGYVGAIRYIDGWWPGSSFGKRSPYDKSIGPAEVASFAAAGLGLQLVWQTSAGFALNGYQQGVSDGRQAAEQIRELGYPADRHPVYFAVDTNVNRSQHATIIAYRNGFAESVPQVGCYGEAELLERLKSDGLIVSGWLPGAASWSDYRTTWAADVTQLVGSPTVGGITIDSNWVNTAVDLWSPGSTSRRHDVPYAVVQKDGTGKGTVWLVGEEKRHLVSAADWPTTAQGINELVAAGVLGGYIELSETALGRVPTALDPDDIADAVIRKLPANPGGGATVDDVRRAVTDVLARIRIGVPVVGFDQSTVAGYAPIERLS